MKAYGTDPIVDEEIMMEFLSTPDSETQHGSGVLMVLVDAWDRKVTREQYLELASAAVTCADNIGRQSMMSAVARFLETNEYEIAPADIDVSLNRTQSQLKKSTGVVRQLAGLLAQTARAEDAIN